MVVGEGAGTFGPRDLRTHAGSGAHIYGEVLGYGTNCDGGHLTTPSADGMDGAVLRALAYAEVAPATMGDINANGTGTGKGDVAENRATFEVFPDAVPVSSTKSFTGHTLGACGALESAFLMAMFSQGFMPPTRNLDVVDPRCAPLDHVRGAAREARLLRVMNNNFAFGGINTSLILGRV